MDLGLTQSVINTSFLTAILCFIVSGGIGYFYWKGFKHPSSIVRAAAWFLYAFCYLGTQFGPDWFIANQRAVFRLTINIILGGELYGLYYAYQFMRPIISANDANKKANGK